MGAGQSKPSELLPLLDRASAWVTGYVTSLQSVVSEERYDQQIETREISPPSYTVARSRTLLSDYLLVHVPGLSAWMPFRDVYAVDGTPIRDRSDRLLRLFVDAPAEALTQAVRIQNESSRYNLGALRDTNVPTFALQILTPPVRPGFAFRLRSPERVNGRDAVVVEYQETSVSTIVVGRQGENVPARGRFWIEPDTGRILRTRLETRPPGARNTIDVTFREDTAAGLWVPGEMLEHRVAGFETMDGRATYSNFRRFQVSTAVAIK
jgi:hypothetical protein